MPTEPMITSTANPRARSWAALHQRKERDRTGHFLIEGSREVARASRFVDVVATIVCPAYAGEGAVDETTVTVSPHVFDMISRRQHPDGIAVVAITPDFALDALAAHPLVLVADGVEKPGNVGAMLRSCDAFGAGFIGSSLATDLVNPNVVRSAQGSLFSTPSASVDRHEAIAWARNHGDVVLAMPDAAAAPLWKTHLASPTVIVVGSESSGIDDAWREAGDPVVIPTVGVADSLNASVAAAIFLAEASRQQSLPR